MSELPAKTTPSQERASRRRPETRRDLIVSLLADAIVELALAELEARERREAEVPPSH